MARWKGQQLYFGTMAELDKVFTVRMKKQDSGNQLDQMAMRQTKATQMKIRTDLITTI